MAKDKAVNIGRKNAGTLNIGKVSPGAAPATPAAGEVYLIGLINMTNETYALASEDFDPQTGSGHWFAIPHTPKNCTTDCDDCYDHQQWQPIVSVSCNAAPFTLTIATLPDNEGNAKGASFPIQPHCDVDGGVVCIVP
jgi:hypothetical protein